MPVYKAPKGGIVSPVNGQFYEGGEFAPDTGLYCGKGKNRVTKVEFDDLAERVKAKHGWTLIFDEKQDRFRLMHPTGNGMAGAKTLKGLSAYGR